MSTGRRLNLEEKFDNLKIMYKEGLPKKRVEKIQRIKTQLQRPGSGPEE